MNAGIIVYSQSGNTGEFARVIADQLRAAAVECTVELIRPYGVPTLWTRSFQFRRIPDVAEYDFILFGAPVWLFGVCPVLPAIFTHIDSLKGKKTLPFVTHAFPFKAGINRALRQISNELDFSQADVLEGESQQFFPFMKNKEQMKATAERIVTRIKENK